MWIGDVEASPVAACGSAEHASLLLSAATVLEYRPKTRSGGKVIVPS